MLEKMLAAGMDVARINFSHGTHETDGSYIAAVRAAATAAGKRVPILQDLAGPRLQTGAEHRFDASAASITEKDLNDLDFGLAQGIEYIVQSFVGSAADIEAMRGHIAERGGTARLIAKVERREAVEAIDDIIAAADAIMLGRGDLGFSVPLEDIPFIERTVIHKCKAARKPIITATQMLYTMKDNPLPTRAEVTDVEYAIMLGSDAVMLSEESATGSYPLEAVIEMDKLIARVERVQPGSVNVL